MNSLALLQYTGGMAMGLFFAAYCGGTLVVLPRHVSEDVLDAVERERITIFPASPTVFTGLLAHPRLAATDWSTVHTCYSGAAPLSEETLRRWRAAVGAPVHEGYGQTEAGPVLSFNPAGGLVKPGSVGVPVPQTEIEIVDVDTGTRVLPPGARADAGELIAHCRANLAKYKVPVRIEIIDALPKTSVNKADKKRLKERAKCGKGG
jgi:long-chain acyl-CoA synthetase